MFPILLAVLVVVLLVLIAVEVIRRTRPTATIVVDPPKVIIRPEPPIVRKPLSLAELRLPDFIYLDPAETVVVERLVLFLWTLLEAGGKAVTVSRVAQSIGEKEDNSKEWLGGIGRSIAARTAHFGIPPEEVYERLRLSGGRSVLLAGSRCEEFCRILELVLDRAKKGEKERETRRRSPMTKPSARVATERVAMDADRRVDLLLETLLAHPEGIEFSHLTRLLGLASDGRSLSSVSRAVSRRTRALGFAAEDVYSIRIRGAVSWWVPGSRAAEFAAKRRAAWLTPPMPGSTGTPSAGSGAA